MNRLAQETSPYLLQHADNPVDWYAWGDEAFERARAEDRPLLLSIGYSACHWCHVMAHESFEDEETARVMNERFVNVKVDREERPDVDALYMDAVVSMTGHGGWPMTVFLTPEGEPFYGGTYFPPEPRHGMPPFRDVLVAVSDLYRDQRGTAASSAARLVQALRASSEVRPSTDPLTEGLISDAARKLRRGFDPEWGGFGGAPKFPQAPTLEFLLRMHLHGDEQALPMVTTTLDSMAAGGMYDLLGGGFHRYSVDRQWLVPHFEKMLYDNALLASTYLHGWVVTGEERYRRVAEETLDYVLRELALPEGGLASAQDADTEGVEGLTFTWAPDDGVPEELLQPFEDGRFVIRGELDEELRGRLWEIREQRLKPGRDDKAIASWNGLALAALAEAGRRLERPDFLEAAERIAGFLLGPLSDDEGRLFRTYRDGRAKNTGFLEDYADAANGLYELHVATGELRWLEEAKRLAELAIELFADDEHGGFFLTPAHGERLIARQKTFEDNPTPSGNSMLAYVLLRLARIYGDAKLERRAVGVFRLVAPALRPSPQFFGHALSALDLHFSPPRELAIVGPPDSEVARAALTPFDPNAVVAFGPANGVPLLEGKDLVDGKPAVYVCENFACEAPVTEPQNLSKTLTNP
ncbi:MAG: thioredoxin domain-containing protein [Actinomycetota bacterium]|nr:thioredoxin domain-containing protein [Actinomycetota bacterium]